MSEALRPWWPAFFIWIDIPFCVHGFAYDAGLGGETVRWSAEVGGGLM